MIRSLKRALQQYVSEVKHATTPRGYSFLEELVLFDFTKEGALEQWDCISDRDVGGGSHATLQPNGKGLVQCKLILVTQTIIVIQGLVRCSAESWISHHQQS